MTKFLREPLLHFLLAGGAIFALVSALAPADTTGRAIEISRDDLLVYMQGRAQVYDAETFSQLLDTMPAEDREELVRDAALQEALYREGLSLQIAEADPLVRQRVIQQMRSLVIEEAAARLELSEEEVRDYFDANSDRYASPAAVSFEHVFFRGDDGEERAAAARERLIAGEQEAGDRFPYQRSYSAASPDVIASQFGAGFVPPLFALAEGEWSQPIRSDLGWHLVRTTSASEMQQMDFAEVESRVREDALAERRQELTRRALDDFLAGYEVTITGDLAE
ncbi:peptidylprolyl isomerase [Aurantiacibacter gilvus]|uniref:Parvulin-like PPIase n=1 Tax=Aurantiacibacter gilvus TaxID=3139141 RepID=A0ABU9IEV2_9SPHN